jgi:hypothetical protein
MSDLWCVQLPTGGVHEVTLDQIDDAFQRGVLDSKTWVFVPANLRWMTLGAILAEPEPAARPAPPHGYPSPAFVQPAPLGAHEAPSSVRPTTLDFEEEAPDLARFKRKGPRRVLFLLAFAGAVWGAAVVRPDLRAAVTAQVESKVKGFRAWPALRAAESKLGELHGWQAVRTAESRLGQSRAWQTIKAAVVRPAPATEPVREVQASPNPPPAVPSAAMPAIAPMPSVIPAVDAPAPQAAATVAASAAAPLTPVVVHSRPSPSLAPHALKARPKVSPPQRPKSGGAGARRAASASASPFTTGGNKYDPLNSDL